MPFHTATYNADFAGNLDCFAGDSRTYNSNNQLTSSTAHPGWTFEYDAAGNPLVYKGQVLSFDPENRLLTYGNSFRADYRSDGLRAWKEELVDGEWQRTYFLYNGNDIVCELDESGQLVAWNTFGPYGLIGRTIPSSVEGEADAETFYQFDALGNVVTRLDLAGEVIDHDAYDAWGTPLAGGSDPFGYKGKFGYYTDRETGLILCTWRYYDPETGRWLTRDPIGMAGGLNLYGYCLNDPVGGVDPLGLKTFHQWYYDEGCGGLSDWTDKWLFGGQTAGLGNATGMWEAGKASGWEVAARGAGWLVTAGGYGTGAAGLGKRLYERQVRRRQRRPLGSRMMRSGLPRMRPTMWPD